MMLKKWEELPSQLQTAPVREYYDILRRHGAGLVCKRIFDMLVSGVLLVLVSPVLLVLAAAIKLDSRGPVFYRQERITRYGKTFRIHKFRTMVQNADKKGTLVTVRGDSRITRMGKLIRKCRLDELPQLLDVLSGNMTLVGVRPEVQKYVDCYTPEMMATLLLPAGVTNLASIYYKDEAELLDGAEDPDRVYVEKVLPGKMYYNLKGIRQFSFLGDIRLLFMTVFAVLGKKYAPEEVQV